jgi:hypothetical protein
MDRAGRFDAVVGCDVKRLPAGLNSGDGAVLLVMACSWRSFRGSLFYHVLLLRRRAAVVPLATDVDLWGRVQIFRRSLRTAA